MEGGRSRDRVEAEGRKKTGRSREQGGRTGDQDLAQGLKPDFKTTGTRKSIETLPHDTL